MSSELTGALRNASSGLIASQRSLDAVAQNVANASTPGYSRRIVQVSQQGFSGTGTGVQFGEVTRRVDEGLMKNLRLQITSLKTVEVQEGMLGRLQTLFGTLESNSSLAHTMSALDAAAQSLALEPQNTLHQSQFVHAARDVAEQLNDLSSNVQNLRREADQKIGAAVAEVNALLAGIDELNADIRLQSSAGREVVGLQDQRDLKLDRLAELMDIRTSGRSTGEIAIFSADGTMLLDGAARSLTHVAAASVAATTTFAGGSIDGLVVNGTAEPVDLTNVMRGGEIGGLMELRDRTLPDLQSSLDGLAGRLRDSVNQVHNRGLAFPGLTKATGSTEFVEPAVQTLRLTGGTDTAIVLFNKDGSEKASTTLATLMGGNGPWTVAQVTTNLNAWLQTNAGASASADLTDGHVSVDLGTTGYALAFRDQAGSAKGSVPADAQIAIDRDGDGTAEATVAGFANALGLNDFFVDGSRAAVQDSRLLDAAYTVGAGSLTFRDAGGALGTVPLTGGESLAEVAERISAVDGLTAVLIPEGGGARLRITADSGNAFSVSETGGGVLADLKLGHADAGTAATLTVRADIAADPSRVSRGAVQWDPDRGASGAYFTGTGDNTIANSLVSTLSAAQSFDAAGGLSATTVTLAAYSASIVSHSASAAETNTARIAYREDVVVSLQYTSDSMRGVNLDEEMSNLILYEQSYAASARVISVIQNLFDTLDRVLG